MTNLKASTQEYFIGAWINPQGHKYKITRMGKTLNSPVRLYVDGELEGTYPTSQKAKAIGKSY